MFARLPKCFTAFQRVDHWPVFLALLAASLGPVVTLASDDGTRVLEEVSAVDQLYDAGISLRGKITVPARPNSLVPSLDYTFVFTNQSPQHAFISELPEVPQPLAMTGDASIYGLPVYRAANGSYRLNLLKKRVIHFDDSMSSSLVMHRVFEFGADGTARFVTDGNAVDLAPGTDSSWSLPYKKVVWCSGRGFGRYLQQPVRIEDLPNGNVRLFAEGFESDSNPGNWELELVPDAAYLARKALFRNLNDEVVFSITNAGIREEHGLPIPETASFSYFGVETERFAFESMQLKADESILAEAKQSMSDRSRPNTLVTDERQSVSVIGHIDGAGQYKRYHDRGDSAMPIAALPTSAWRWLLIVANMAVFGGLLFMWWRERRRSAIPANES